MKRALLISLLAVTLLSGCVAHTGGVAFVAPVPVAVVSVGHVHGPGCGHFWGYWSGYPVYYHGGHYSYWDGGTWIVMRQAPVVRYDYYHRHHHYRPRGHAHGHYRSAPAYRAAPAQPHRAVPAR